MLALSGTFLSQFMDSSWTPFNMRPPPSLPLCLLQTEEPGDLPEQKTQPPAAFPPSKLV